MSNTTFKQDMQQKIDTIWRFVVWIVAYLISLALCLPGIFISIQYANDSCVKGSGTINIALDAWLFIACLFVQVYMLVILVFICLNARDKTFRVFWICVHVLQLGWYIIGIYLIVNSTLDCKHNSLWQMSVAYCAIMGSAWFLETIWMSLKWSGCIDKCSCSLCERCFSSTEETYYFIQPINTSSSSSTNGSNWVQQGDTLIDSPILFPGGYQHSYHDVLDDVENQCDVLPETDEFFQ